MIFSASTDVGSQLRVWVDNHILLDCPFARQNDSCTSLASLPVSAGAPVQLRVEVTHGVGSWGGSALALFWSGNLTVFGEVPASVLSPTVPAWETERVAMRDRLQSPSVQWQTWTQNMAAHALMPQGLSLDATLRNLASGDELGDIAPWRSFDPAFVRPGIHSLNGSDYTHFTLSRWGALNCSVEFYSTVVEGDLVWLIESVGSDCAILAVNFRALMKWGYSGSFQITSPTAFTAILPGFSNVSVTLVAGTLTGGSSSSRSSSSDSSSSSRSSSSDSSSSSSSSLPPLHSSPSCNLTGSWCCAETVEAEDGTGHLSSSASYGTGLGIIVSGGGNNITMRFSNAPTTQFFGYADEACNTLYWLNDGSSWKRSTPPPLPPPPTPFSPFLVHLGTGPIVLATGRTAATLNISVAQALVAAAAARAAAWINASAPPGLADAFEPLSAVLLWDTIFTPYLSPVTASSRLWVCTGDNPACAQTGYTIFNWDMPMCSWTWAGLDTVGGAGELGSGFAKDMAYAQLIEDAYTRTMMGFVPNYSSGTFASGDRTQPPLFGFVAMEHYRRYGDTWLLEALFDPLSSYLDFLWEYRRGAGIFAAGSQDGRVALFSWGSNNFSGGDAAACTKQAAAYESGLDDSPMWDEADWSPCEGGLGLMMLYDAGLTGLFLSEAVALISIAGVIGRGDVIPLLQARFNATATAMNAHLWNASRSIYQNVQWDGTPSVHLSPTSYYPLMAGPSSGAVPVERAEAMGASLADPLGMCLNTSAKGPAGLFAATISRWAKMLPGGAVDTATCVSAACITDLVIQQYPLSPNASLGAIILNTSAVSSDGSSDYSSGREDYQEQYPLIPLANWFSEARSDTALTNSNTVPPYGDASYTLLRLEGYCLPSASSTASPAIAITSWRNGNDTAACSSSLCEADMSARGYTPLGTLCWAFNATSLADYPCAYGAPSISRDDPQFDHGDGTGYYWRGRIWPATEGTLYWALMGWNDSPSLVQARQALAGQARALANFHWTAWGAVCENAHAILGSCAEMAGQGQPGSDDPLLNWSGIGPYLNMRGVAGGGGGEGGEAPL